MILWKLFLNNKMELDLVNSTTTPVKMTQHNSVTDVFENYFATYSIRKMGEVYNIIYSSLIAYMVGRVIFPPPISPLRVAVYSSSLLSLLSKPILLSWLSNQ